MAGVLAALFGSGKALSAAQALAAKKRQEEAEKIRQEAEQRNFKELLADGPFSKTSPFGGRRR